MTPADAAQFGPVDVALKDHRPVTLRLLAADDEVRLGDFYLTVPREDYRFYRAQALGRELAREVMGKVHSPTDVVLVACAPDNDSIVGYAWYVWQADKPATSVFGLCVRRSHQGAGLGRALMLRLTAIARDIGPPVMTLTVQVANPHAVELYRQRGFRIVRQQMRGATKDFPAEPEYYMERAVR
jgi:ribosomal protein S18 acetylase RimI-like enzyme